MRARTHTHTHAHTHTHTHAYSHAQVGTGAAIAIDASGWEDAVVWNPHHTMKECYEVRAQFCVVFAACACGHEHGC